MKRYIRASAGGKTYTVYYVAADEEGPYGSTVAYEDSVKASSDDRAVEQAFMQVLGYDEEMIEELKQDYGVSQLTDLVGAGYEPDYSADSTSIAAILDGQRIIFDPIHAGSYRRLMNMIEEANQDAESDEEDYGYR